MYKIDIDEEVYNLLKEKAEPFVDINPNSVLRHLLLNNSKTNKGDKPNVLPEFPASVPHALAETLEMIILVVIASVLFVIASKLLTKLDF